MAPPSAATAAPARRHAGGHSPARRWGRGAGTAAPETRRPPLRVVPGRTKPRTAAGTGAGRTRPVTRRGRPFNIVAVSLVVSALLAVVVAQAMLANGQVRLSALEHRLSLEQGAHRQAELAVSELETPSRIVAAAGGQLHMVRPANIVELPYVSLSAPVATPKVTPAPPPPPPPPATTSTTSAAGSGTGSGSATSTGASGASSTTGTATATATSIP